MNEIPKNSIFHTLKDRSDLVFKGHAIEEENTIEDRNIQLEDGSWVHHRHDWIKRKFVDGEEAAILVADIDDKGTNVDHPYWYLPHISAIYTKEEYRGRGLATELIDEFMSEIERDKLVADYLKDVKDFYHKLDYFVYNMQHFKE